MSLSNLCHFTWWVGPPKKNIPQNKMLGSDAFYFRICIDFFKVLLDPHHISKLQILSQIHQILIWSWIHQIFSHITQILYYYILIQWIFPWYHDPFGLWHNYAEEPAPTTPPHSVEPTAQVMAVRWKQTAPTRSPIALKAATASPGGEKSPGRL